MGGSLFPKAFSFFLLLFLGVSQSLAGPATWTNVWDGFQSHFLDSQGRVIDYQEGGISTSEGEAYALFFSLVANDRGRFARILTWTQNNLAQGSLADHLPVWKWGKNAHGHWGPLSSESASDADLWIAYTLIQAARLWQEPGYAHLARQLLQTIEKNEVVSLPQWGMTLLPGDGPYWREMNRYIINLSYEPPFLLQGLASFDPHGPWQKLLDQLPRLYAVACPKGFAPDWFTLLPNGSGQTAPLGPDGSYNAIRTYLWLGLSPQNAWTLKIQSHLWGMEKLLAAGSPIPLIVQTQNGITSGQGPIGFVAALLPYLRRWPASAAYHRLSAMLYASWKPQQEQFSSHYYDTVLALFALGYVDHLYAFAPNGDLQVFWQ